MWFRVCVMWLVVASTPFLAGAGQSGGAQNRRPSDTYDIRPSVAVSVQYGSSGEPCAMLVRPESAIHPLNTRTNKVGDYKQVERILAELVPQSKRGKFVAGTGINIVCGSDYPNLDCGGAKDEWEKVIVYRSGGSDTQHFATVVWKRAECRGIQPEAN